MEFISEIDNIKSRNNSYLTDKDSNIRTVSLPLDSIDEYNELFRILDEQIAALEKTIKKIRDYRVNFKITV